MPDVTTMVTVIRDAIRNHRQLFFTVKDHPREFCPHVLGTKEGVWHVFGWQFGGSSSSRPLPPGGEWRCIELRDITSGIEVQDGEWYRGWTTGQRGQSCVDHIDTIIDEAHAAEVQNTSRMRTR